MYRRYLKRIFDIFFSLVGFPFFVVLFIFIAPVIVFEDKGPVFYNAPRLGYKGKIFKMYKFRSMKINAPDLRNEDGTTYNSENDSRVTRVGRFLRKTSLDEIPQLLNVLIGDMSFVGPRPDLPNADKELYRPGDEKKLDVRPGITGFNQAYYRNSSTLEQRFSGDVYYAEHVSFLLDIKIIVQTVKMVFNRKNIYRN